MDYSELKDGFKKDKTSEESERTSMPPVTISRRQFIVQSAKVGACVATPVSVIYPSDSEAAWPAALAYFLLGATTSSVISYYINEGLDELHMQTEAQESIEGNGSVNVTIEKQVIINVSNQDGSGSVSFDYDRCIACGLCFGFPDDIEQQSVVCPVDCIHFSLGQ